MEYLSIAREAVAMYETVGDEDLVEVQHLLTVILGTKKATPELTGKLSAYGLHGLINMRVQDLEINGLNHNDALKLHAALIFAKKLAKKINTNNFNEQIKSPSDLAKYFIPKLRHLKQEHLIAIYVNTKNCIVKEKTIFIGSLNAAILHPREIFGEAITSANTDGVAGIFIAHNHPSGDPLNIVS